MCPLREYWCSNCKKQFEELHKSYKDILITCPECGNNVKLLLSASNFNLIGAGFFSNDYKKKEIKSKPTDKKEKI